jgi:hypothetical protein
MRFVTLVLLLAFLTQSPGSARGGGSAVGGAAAVAPGDGATPGAAFLPNYARGAGILGLRRWKRLPVRVFFENGDAYPETLRKGTLAGFDQWTTATNGVLGYRVVGSAAAADVTVRFHAGPNLPPDPQTVGRTTFVARGIWLKRAHVDLATGAAGARSEELEEVAAHEWGHALGVNGHSDDPNDLMHGVTVRYIVRDPFSAALPRRARTVTERDLNTVKTCYAPLFAANGNRGAAPGGAKRVKRSVPAPGAADRRPRREDDRAAGV